MITIVVDDLTVDCYSGDIVNDIIHTSVGAVPFEWSTGFELQQATDAITAYLAGEAVVPESTGSGWFIYTASLTHPCIEVQSIDFVNNLLNFRWEGGYPGDCAVAFDFTESTTPAEIVAACASLIPS